jgi:hypothetical protein
MVTAYSITTRNKKNNKRKTFVVVVGAFSGGRHTT